MAVDLGSISVEAILDAAGATYKLTHGASGPQINVRECPRCGDVRYKVYINRDTGLGNCWVCPPGENAFNKYLLAKLLLGDNIREQLERLSTNQRWMTRLESNWAQPELKLPDSLALPYLGMLPDYLINRHITAQSAKYFEMRYCDDGYFESNGKRMDFSKRVIFPIRDVTGKLVSFQGRDVTGNARAKYLFPPGFSVSGSVLYNAHNATQADVLLMVEGVFDCVAAKQALLSNGVTTIEPVASFGKHLAINKAGSDDDQLSVLLRLKQWFGIKHVWFAWDGTPDAQLAAVLAMRQLKRSGFETKLVELPPGSDPNEIPADLFVQCIHQATAYSDSLLARVQLAGM